MYIYIYRANPSRVEWNVRDGKLSALSPPLGFTPNPNADLALCLAGSPMG